MKHSNGETHNYLIDFFTEDEIHSSRILLELPRLIFEVASCRRLPLDWGIRKRRSAIDKTASPTPPPPVLPASRVVETCSPVTPFSFSPTESDLKSKRLKRKFSKQTKEEYEKMIDDELKCRKALQKSLQNLKNRYEHLKQENVALKARKLDLEQRKRLNLDLELAQPNVDQEHHEHQVPVLDRQGTASQPSTCENVQIPVAQMLAFVDAARESRRSEAAKFLETKMAKAMAAQARRRRIQICRVKNPIGGRFPPPSKYPYLYS